MPWAMLSDILNSFTSDRERHSVYLHLYFRCRIADKKLKDPNQGPPDHPDNCPDRSHLTQSALTPSPPLARLGNDSNMS